MGKIVPFTIDNRYKGMSDDVRIQDSSYYALSLHFDNFTNPKRAIPFRSTEDDTTSTDYRIARGISYGGKLYGLGRKSTASNITKIYEKSSNIITDSWTASTSGEDASGTPEFASFIQYEGFLFMFANGTRIAAYNIGTPAFTATAVSLTSYTNPAQAIVTGDDLLLVPYDNKIAVKDGGSDATSNWETARLTLPSTLKIMDIEEWGDQVAIVCAPVTAETSHSYLYIWNKIDADISTRVDLGEGKAQIVADIDGVLAVLMVVGGDSSTNHFKGKVVLKRYLGGVSADTICEIEADSSAITVQRTTKIKDQNKCEFAMKLVLDGTTYHALWVIGKKKTGYPIILSPHHLINNDTVPTTVEGAWKVGQYYWFSINSGTVVRTNNDSAYTATSIYISQKIISGPKPYSMKWAGVTCPPLPAGSTVSLYYRVDNGSFTKIFDYTTANGMGKQSGIDSAGTDFTQGSEFQFKLTTTGGTALPASWNSIEGEFEESDSEMTN